MIHIDFIDYIDSACERNGEGKQIEFMQKKKKNFIRAYCSNVEWITCVHFWKFSFQFDCVLLAFDSPHKTKKNINYYIQFYCANSWTWAWPATLRSLKLNKFPYRSAFKISFIDGMSFSLCRRYQGLNVFGNARAHTHTHTFDNYKVISIRKREKSQ